MGVRAWGVKGASRGLGLGFGVFGLYRGLGFEGSLRPEKPLKRRSLIHPRGTIYIYIYIYIWYPPPPPPVTYPFSPCLKSPPPQ